MRRYFEDGVFLIALESIRDPTLVVSAIAQTLHVSETPDGRPLAEVLADHLRDKHMLLLLDNFEQVVSAAPAYPRCLKRPASQDAGYQPDAAARARRAGTARATAGAARSQSTMPSICRACRSTRRWRCSSSAHKA